MSIAGLLIVPTPPAPPPAPPPEPPSESSLDFNLLISSMPINASNCFFALSAFLPTLSVAPPKLFIAPVASSIPPVAPPKSIAPAPPEPPEPPLILNPIALRTELNVFAICTNLAIIVFITLITGVSTAIKP